MPCSFWLKGSCNKGNRCKFAHPQPKSTSSTESTPPKEASSSSNSSPSSEGVADSQDKSPNTPTTEKSAFEGQSAEQLEAAINQLMLNIWLESAEKGHADAQFLVGSVYAEGDTGVSKDEAKGIEWYKKAAKQVFFFILPRFRYS